MSSKDRRKARAHRRAIAVERLEGRDLMSMIPILLTQARNAANQARISSALASLAGGDTGGTASGTAVPTPHEAARERFVGKFSGSYVMGPGRFTDQSQQASFLGTGGSNQALRLNLQMEFFVPTDPTQPTTGVAALTDKNVGNTGNSLILDLTSAPGATFRGLPMQFTWTVDPASGGVWANVGGLGTGQGTLEVHYVPGGKLPRRATGAGRAYMEFQGAINTSHVTNVLSAPGNTP